MVGVARLIHTQQIHYLRKRVNFSDRGIATGNYLGTVPAGAMLVGNFVRVGTAFNGTGAALNVGTTPTGTEVFTDAGTVGARSPAIAALTFATDTDLFVSAPGTGATTGVGDIIVIFVPNLDA